MKIYLLAKTVGQHIYPTYLRPCQRSMTNLAKIINGFFTGYCYVYRIG